MMCLDRSARVLIVDDHPVVRAGFRTMLEDVPDLEVCGEADGAAAALEALERNRPDLMIVDISLADGSGLDLVKQVAHSHPSVRMLIASMHDESLFAERALRAGAHGYINKSAAVGDLVAAVRKVLSGSIVLSQEMTDRLLMSVAAGDLTRGVDELSHLSDRELEVFELLGQGRTTKETADHLNLSIKTIETYRENIKEKLSIDNNNELICRAAQWVVRESSSTPAHDTPRAADGSLAT